MISSSDRDRDRQSNTADGNQAKNTTTNVATIGQRSRSSRTRPSFLYVLGCLCSLVAVSAFRPGLPLSDRHPTTMKTKIKNDSLAVVLEHPRLHSALSERSTTKVEAVPSERKRRSFGRILRRRISRRSTSRSFRNDGDGLIAVEEIVGSDSDESTETEAESKVTNDTDGPAEIGDRIRAIGQEISSGQALRQPTQNIRQRTVTYFASSLSKTNPRKKKPDPIEIETVEELRNAILDQQLSLADTVIVERKSTTKQLENTKTKALAVEEPIETVQGAPQVFDHAVRDLIRERFVNGTTPGHRLPEDTATLALAIEGGGMRGCVSAGMVAAITALGLSDSIDSIYGSSAGSVIGAYVVSRQVCLDVYVDILPASKELFVCKKRMVTNLASMGLERMLLGNRRNRSKTGQPLSITKIGGSSSPQVKTLRDRLFDTPPGMNISFVLDGILSDDHGLRPLDVDTFRKNDLKQKLRVVSSCVDPRTGKLESRCFGGSEDFFCPEERLVRVDDRRREGLFACLQASMTVPGATGPPVNLVRKNELSISDPTPCFDAFCFEPIPYRSAVEEGATHVLVLASRPEDYIPKTKPGIYETGIAPLYFNSHGQKRVAEYFEQGGQQYIYAEDLMLLEEARLRGNDGILVPPPEILYGVPRTTELDRTIRGREETWKRAHLFPLRVPKGYKELDALEQDKDAVLEAVRDGFMTAFDSLKDIVGLEDLDGTAVSRLIFPSTDDDDEIAPEVEGRRSGGKGASSLSPREQQILGTKLHVPGEPIPEARRERKEEEQSSTSGNEPKQRRIFTRRLFRRGRLGGLFGHGKHDGAETELEHNQDPRGPDFQPHNMWQRHDLSKNDLLAIDLMQTLPGFRDGSYGHLAKGLINQREEHIETYTASNRM
eukprot:CAMPEP_0172391000 /NCGR_PEP_ID=MMETSP1061-20121228/7522_1 /TAXON_ID=37318 /ORGANISM="Pseudo-nitzschia pungens, Strain cf. pungens" /LENGTH=889 /DNA_ID=CAMNT_0013121521 /DNA_START=451 /DNA_END=3120 /DNA_ORIENTATION=-